MRTIHLLQGLVLAGLLAATTLPAARSSAATPTAEPPYYSYVLYLRAEPKRSLVAEAEAIARPLLTRHRLVDAAKIKAWERRGQAPISFAQRSGPQKKYEQLETNDGELFSDLFRSLADLLAPGRTSEPITELVINIGAPIERDIPSYVEGVEVAVALAKALGAVVILDEETGERRRSREWNRRAYEGHQREPPTIISEQNPPLLFIDGAIRHDRFQRGWHTRGMRKFGLPDLVLEDPLPGYNSHWVISLVANLLVSGHRLHERTGELVIRADDPIVKSQLRRDEATDGRTIVRLVPARPFKGRPAGRVVEISFDAHPHPTPHERQMQFVLDLRRNFYPELTDDERRTLALAIARAKSKIADLRRRFNALRADGTRVFVAMRSDADIETAYKQKKSEGWAQLWEEVIKWPQDKWPQDGHFTLRRWRGDPRTGGQVFRLQNPTVIGGKTYEFVDSNGPDGMIEDLLVIDKNGKAEGGEVTELLKTLLPVVAKRSAK